MRYASKEQFLESTEAEHLALLDLLHSVPPEMQTVPGVWGDDWTVKDLLAHLTEWEQMFLGWFRCGLEGEPFQMPAEGFKYNQVPQLNQKIWRQHRDEPLEVVVERFHDSYQEILGLAWGLSEEELLEPGHFAWTKKYPLTTYLGPNTDSHYRTAKKILKRWLRQREAT